jgi:hypothetical protein
MSTAIVVCSTPTLLAFAFHKTIAAWPMMRIGRRSPFHHFRAASRPRASLPPSRSAERQQVQGLERGIVTKGVPVGDGPENVALIQNDRDQPRVSGLNGSGRPWARPIAAVAV